MRPKHPQTANHKSRFKRGRLTDVAKYDRIKRRYGYVPWLCFELCGQVDIARFAYGQSSTSYGFIGDASGVMLFWFWYQQAIAKRVYSGSNPDRVTIGAVGPDTKYGRLGIFCSGYWINYRSRCSERIQQHAFQIFDDGRDAYQPPAIFDDRLTLRSGTTAQGICSTTHTRAQLTLNLVTSHGRRQPTNSLLGLRKVQWWHCSVFGFQTDGATRLTIGFYRCVTFATNSNILTSGGYLQIEGASAFATDPNYGSPQAQQQEC